MNQIEPAPSVDSLLTRIGAAFTGAFGSRPAWAARAPGRVNLIGEHTDYNQGFVLPIAIDRCCLCVAAPAADPRVSRILAADLGQLVEVDLTGDLDRDMTVRGGPGGQGGATPASRSTLPPISLAEIAWARYALGVAAQFRTRLGSLSNLDIALSSSVPLGSGLSSSAALEASVATILEAAAGITLDPLDKARLCQRAEHAFPSVPCGIMDPLASICGVQDHALLIDCRDETYSLVPMPPPAQAVVLIANTNVYHALAGGQYAKRRAACEAAAKALSVASLRDATGTSNSPALARLTQEQRNCVTHVLSENERTIRVAGLLRASAAAAHDHASSDWRTTLEQIGAHMLDSHHSLSETYGVSCPELDTLVELAMALGRSRGVYGARMTGGGFGGCIIALVHPRAVTDVALALHQGYQARHQRDCTVYTTRACDGAVTLLFPEPPGAGA